jgi:phage replication O-like protein O
MHSYLKIPRKSNHTKIAGYYTQIPNPFIEKKMRDLNGTAVKVFLAIARRTLCWQRLDESITLNQLQRMTGASRQGVLNALDELKKHKLIDIKRGEWKRGKKNHYTVKMSWVKKLDLSVYKLDPSWVKKLDYLKRNEITGDADEVPPPEWELH